MRVEKLDNMIKGWFVGNFIPTLYKTNEVEVALKRYRKGDCEERHFHKIATEITVVVSGIVKMNERVIGAGEMVVLDPGESSDFEALSDAVNVVVKLPGANNDKYIVTQEDKIC